ncbi:MAG: altronate dehydratase, partial [Ferruginibacter sp.]|nr:altronate dehydratase [Ferruginibacter sp.]
MVSKSVLQIDTKDNVMVALQNLRKGDIINKYNKEVVLQNDIKAKHKFFTKNMQPGDEVIM